MRKSVYLDESVEKAITAGADRARRSKSQQQLHLIELGLLAARKLPKHPAPWLDEGPRRPKIPKARRGRRPTGQANRPRSYFYLPADGRLLDKIERLASRLATKQRKNAAEGSYLPWRLAQVVRELINIGLGIDRLVQAEVDRLISNMISRSDALENPSCAKLIRILVATKSIDSLLELKRIGPQAKALSHWGLTAERFDSCIELAVEIVAQIERLD